jgi:hypothetical protein
MTLSWHINDIYLCIVSTTSKPAPTLISIYVPANSTFIVALGDKVVQWDKGRWHSMRKWVTGLYGTLYATMSSWDVWQSMWKWVNGLYGTLCDNEITAYMAHYVIVLKTLRITISPHTISSWLLLMSMYIKVYLQSPTWTANYLFIEFSCYEKMVLKLRNPLKLSSQMILLPSRLHAKQ